MVLLMSFLRCKSKILTKNYVKSSFIDRVRIYVRGGSGGMGYPKYGGVGGKGGDVYVLAKSDAELSAIKKQFPEKRIKAGHGGNSQERQLLGSRGQDVTVTVPCGVKIFDEFRKCLGEVNNDGEKILVAKGGFGGCPINRFHGMSGQKFNVLLELSLIADIGLLGFPNAGKSTLLKACSKARPKIADYPFTTIRPNVGVIEYRDFRKITMADLPGLIEGAHKNFGMGHRFLRHIERTKLMLMIVDVNGFQLNKKYDRRSAIETVLLLNKELELFNEELLDKPATLIVNKMDEPDAHKHFDELRRNLENIGDVIENFPEFMRPNRMIEFKEVIPISAKNNPEDVVKVKNHIRIMLDELHKKEQPAAVVLEVQEKLKKLREQGKEVGPSLI